jgi:hypothetical protein
MVLKKDQHFKTCLETHRFINEGVDGRCRTNSAREKDVLFFSTLIPSRGCNLCCSMANPASNVTVCDLNRIKYLLSLDSGSGKRDTFSVAPPNKGELLPTVSLPLNDHGGLVVGAMLRTSGWRFFGEVTGLVDAFSAMNEGEWILVLSYFCFKVSYNSASFRFC